MLVYCMIAYLMGMGIFLQIYNKEKKAGLYKKNDKWAYFVVWLSMPVALPFLIGYALGDNYEPNDDK